jgi:hypothetical protein
MHTPTKSAANDDTIIESAARPPTLQEDDVDRKPAAIQQVDLLSLWEDDMKNLDAVTKFGFCTKT